MDGECIAPARFSVRSDEYRITFTFGGMQGHCSMSLSASATDVHQNAVRASYVTGIPCLALDKRANLNSVLAGERLSYALTVTNTGNVTLTATITDVLPDHVATVQPLIWTPVIPPGGVWTQTVVVTVEMGYAGPLTNVVKVTTEEGATGVYTESVTAVVTPALVVVKQAESTSVAAGGRLSYTLTVTNTGNVTLTATITDVLPDHVATVQPLIWTPVIPPGGVWTRTVVVTVEKDYVGTLVNVVQVTTEEGATGIDSVTVCVNTCIYLPFVLKDFS